VTTFHSFRGAGQGGPPPGLDPQEEVELLGQRTVESESNVGGCPGVRGGGGRPRTSPCRRGHPLFRGWGSACVEGSAMALPRTRLHIGVFTERHYLVPPRAKLTNGAARWATDC
jgi:hypothetical protein